MKYYIYDIISDCLVLYICLKAQLSVKCKSLLQSNNIYYMYYYYTGNMTWQMFHSRLGNFTDIYFRLVAAYRPLRMCTYIPGNTSRTPEALFNFENCRHNQSNQEQSNVFLFCKL